MKAVLLRSCLVLCGLVCMASSSSAQPPVGALAVDERQGTGMAGRWTTRRRRPRGRRHWGSAALGALRF